MTGLAMGRRISKLLSRAALAAAPLLLCGCAISTVQWGSTDNDSPSDIAVDAAGNSYVVYTSNKTTGTHRFLEYRDPAGTRIRVVEISAPQPKVAVNSALGVVYVAGQWGSGVMLERYDMQGNWLGMTEWTDIKTVADIGVSPADQVFVAGSGGLLGDLRPRITTLSSNGAVVRTKVFPTIGTQRNTIKALCVDSSGFVRIAGEADDNTATVGNDVFMLEYLPWYEEFSVARWTVGSSSEVSDIASNGSIVAVTGSLWGAGNPGGDVFLTRLDRYTGVLGTTTWGSAAEDAARAVAIAPNTSIYVVGSTRGQIVRPAQSWDVFATRLDANGGIIGTHQWGSTSTDTAVAAVMDAQGRGYVFGGTYGNMAAPPQGSQDLFLSFIRD